MKSASSPETPRQNSRKKVSKPVMEKRRRERINHSLETLRLLMLENTQNEKLKNPKVEKAEILESVVEFLKTEKEMERSQQALKEVLAREQRASGGRHQSYRDGMKSCLLRVSQFIACKSLELEESGVARGGTFTLSEAQELAASSGHLHMSPIHIPADVPAALSSPPHHLTSAESSKAISSSSTAPVSAHITDPVWRPWPV